MSDTTGRIAAMRKEEARYAAVQQQMKELLDAAATPDASPATTLLRAQLYAELFARNEQTHQRVLSRLRSEHL